MMDTLLLTKRDVYKLLKDSKEVQKFIGEAPTDFPHALDRDNPVSIGAYMNEPDTINNRYQQSEAMYNAEKVFERIAKEYAELTGREYPILDLYKMEDAEVAVFMLNSAAEV